MKIAIISPALLPVPAVKGGAVESIIQLFIDQNEQDDSNISIIVISAYDKEAVKRSRTYKKTKFIWIKHQSIVYCIINFIIRVIRRVFHVDLDYFETFLIMRALKKQECDKIVVEGNAMHAAFLLQNMNKEKIYFHIHANIIKSATEKNKYILNGCNKTIVVSNFIKNTILHTLDANENKIMVLMNCIDYAKYQTTINKQRKDELESKYGIGPEDVVILFVGRIVAEKGIMELLGALNMLPKQSKYKLIIAGSYGSNFGAGDVRKHPLRDKIERISCGIEDRIVHAGYICNSKLHELYSIGDIGVVPSICEDAAPLVPIEMMASGLPLVVTDAGGLPEYVNRDCAITVERDENLVRNLAYSIEKLICDKGLRLSMGLAGKCRAREFTSDQYYKSFVRLLTTEINDN